MKQFDINRFGLMLRWSLTMARDWFLRTTLSWAVMLTLMYLFFTCVVGGHEIGRYEVSAFIAAFITAVVLVLCPSFMFATQKGTRADQSLLVLPASNLEKYLVCYCRALLSLPCLAAALVVADLLQLCVNALLGHEPAMLVVSVVVQAVNDIRNNVTYSSGLPEWIDLLMRGLWFHSLYALGATFFRAHKYNWVLTSIVLFVGMILLHLLPHELLLSFMEPGRVSYISWLHLCLAAFNFWLSYRLFCRTQVIGKFVNI